VVCRNEQHAKPFVDMFGNGCKYYDSLDKACTDNKVDFVVICTPTSTHEEYTIKAASYGCHVLCEKPATFTEESFDRMTAACDKAGVKFMIAQILRFRGEFAKIREYVQTGKLGDVHFFYEKRLCQHPTWGTWQRDPLMSGGGLYDLNVHDIDNLYSIFGMPETVYATGWKSDTGCFNHITTTLTWKSGAKAVCESSLEMTGNFPFTVEVRGTGDKGTIQYMMSAGFNINDGNTLEKLVFYPTDVEQPIELEADELGGFDGQLGAFIDAITNDTEVPVASSDIRDVLTIINATKKSLETNMPVSI